MQLDPALHSTRLRVVESLIARGENDSAGEYLKAVLPLPIADSTVLLQYGSMAEQSGLAEEALSFYREAVQRDETNVKALIGGEEFWWGKGGDKYAGSNNIAFLSTTWLPRAFTRGWAAWNQRRGGKS